MKTTSLAVVAAVLLAAVSVPTLGADEAPAAASAQVRVIRDARGRVQGQITVAPDGSREVATQEYWQSSSTIRRRSIDTIDAKGRLHGRTSESFDLKGRLRERRSVRVDPGGAESGSVTRVEYDAQGRAHEHVSPVGR